MNLSIIIPCYNEAQNIPFMRKQLLPVLASLDVRVPAQVAHTASVASTIEVILVDDGSTDETLAQLEALAAETSENAGSQSPAGVQCPLEVRVVRHRRNRGLGAAIRTGFERACGDIIVTTDSDGTYPFAEIPSLLTYMEPGVDIVAASPYHPAGGVAGVTPFRLLLSQGASLLYRILLDWHLHTYTAMFRAYRREVVAHVPSTADGFLMPAEFLANAILMGYNVVEYPTVLHVRRHGQSKARVARIVLAHLRFQARLAWLRLTRQRPGSACKISQHGNDR
jgi:dolichol-phosphate mannosyltransferase